VKKWFLITVLLLLFCANGETQQTTYYVSPTGSGSDCTIGDPCSLNYGLSQLSAGKTLYLRGGTYTQIVSFSTNGAEGNEIRIQGYTGETAIIDGSPTIPSSDWGVLFDLNGDYVILEDLTVRESNGMGLVVDGDHNQIIDVYSHSHDENGILVRGSYNIVDDCDVYNNSLSEEAGWSGGLNVGSNGTATGNLIKNCKVWYNFGEGLSCYEGMNTTIQDCEVYDNYSVNIYISDATGCMVQRNLVYNTGAMTSGSRTGIAVSSEGHSPTPDNNRIINNIVYGTRRCFHFYNTAALEGFTNSEVCNNVFMNTIYDNTIQINNSSLHSNTIIKNNIIRQDDTLAPIEVGNYAGLDFGYNCWSDTQANVDADAEGPGDIYQCGGSPSYDCDLVGSDWTVATSYKINGNIGSIYPRDKGYTSASVTEDYWETERPQGDYYDMGAHEFESEVPPPTVTIEATDPNGHERNIDTATIRFTRTTSSGNLTVNFTINPASTASSNDYDEDLSGGFVTILDGNTYVDQTITPTADVDRLEGRETLILNLAADSYTIGSPSQATIYIEDDAGTMTGVPAGGGFSLN